MLAKDPPPGVAAFTPNQSDITKIQAQITGPEGSPFEGGIFLLTVNITGRYPFEPPRCRFLTPLYHPNIDSGGRICLDTLKTPPAGSWSPAVSLPSLLLSIRSLMAEPNPDDGLVPDISELYKRNPTEWHRVAKERARSEATMEKLEEMESLLDRECSTNNNNSLQESIVTGNVNNEGPQQTSKVDSKAALSSVELKNVDYERDSKRSKLSSRR
jgi:ubiquitin-conjugating enzyme E2 T